ncbi:MAG: SusC/RagA family TonB-linked outer membrane protein [Gemmatimonadota bacterium]|nr:SusC/RagA family TonB-linked outer membrane protein [Gemmatimonadota bacterium]
MTISGKVTSEAGQPIVGANVSVSLQGQFYGSVAKDRGQYSFTVPSSVANGQTTTITARFFGFAPIKKTITLTGSSVTADFALKADPFRLSELVITGVATETSLNKVPFSIAKVDAQQMKEVPASSPVAALAGKVSGTRIELASGDPGAAPTIRLRGATNLGVGGSTPLILIDGVITKFSMADIDASDVENIEVLKGAAAASFYGSDAANGVLNITTKRGKDGAEGEMQIRTRSEFGTSDIEHYVPTNKHHYWVLNADGSFKTDATGGRTMEADGIMDNKYPATGADMWRDQLKTWLENGSFYSNNVQLSMKRGSTNFASSFTSDHDQGIMPMRDGFFRQTARLNVDQAVNPKMDLSMSVTYGTSKYDLPQGSTGAWFPLLQAPPDLDLKWPDAKQTTIPFFPKLPVSKGGALRENPLYNLSVASTDFNRERFLGSASVRYRPFEWLKLDASYGTDRSNRRSNNYTPRGSLTANAQATDGALSNSASNDVAENMQMNAIASKLWFGNFNTTTRASYLIEKFHEVYSYAGGSKLNVSQVPDMSALDPSLLNVSSYNRMMNSVNYMISQAFDYKDRYVLDALYRKDGSSLFGPDARWADFYRVATTYRVTEDFQIPNVQELRIRAAQGTAGLRPSFSDQYETYSLANGQYSKNQLGNKMLKPAVQTEKEFGLNMQFLNRFDLEVVKADRRTVGAFLAVPLSLAASGGFRNQVQNAATVAAKTMEYSLQANVLDKANFKWSMGITADQTTQKIEKLGRSAFRVNADGSQGQDVFFYREGEPLGIIYGQKWVRNPQQLLDNPVNKANTAFSLDNYTVNSDGFVVLKANLGKMSEAPIKYIDATGNDNFVIGDVNPDISFGVSNTFRYKGIAVYALFNGVQGGDIYNFTKQWMTQDERTAMQDQGDRPAADRRPSGFYQQLYNALNANDVYVEDGSYVKLRELSVSYTLTPRLLETLQLNRVIKGAKIALIGRNLKTWTNYTGFDPEVSSGNDFNFRIDGFKYPNFRKITGQFELTF